MSAKLSIGQHFTRLLDFSGREDRASFWPYAAVAFAIVTVLGALIFIPLVVDAMQAMQRFAAENPDQVTVRQGPGHYSVSVHGDHPRMFSAGGVLTFLVVTFGSALILYPAAVVRRLRDARRAVVWALLPLPFILFSTITMPQILGGADPDSGLFLASFVSNLLYNLSLVVLIVMLALPSKPRPGDEL